MLILACDTSGNSCSACLIEDGKIKAESFLSAGLTHSQTFMPMVEEMRKSAAVAYTEIDAFACAVGPGSFTGIRIGVSAIKTMAMLVKKPAVPVSSLKALANPFAAMKNTLIISLIDARNRRVFSSGYLNEKDMIPESAGAVEDLWDMITKIYEKYPKNCTSILLCGNAASMYKEELEKSGFAVQIAQENKKEIRASEVAEIAYGYVKDASPEELFQRFSPTALSPVYLAKTAAENNLPGH